MKKHIIYLTTAMNKNDFKEYLDHWTSPPNPSNQNFHNKMIRALSLGYNVDVISLRPFSNSLVDLKKLEKSELVEDNITWHYLPIHGNKIIRYINCKQNVNKLIKKLYTDESIIFTDTINTSVVRYLSYARKKNNYDIIGLVTDSPSNISNTRRSYTAYLLEANNNYKGYISLTKELDELFNIYGKPSKIIEGIVEKPANISKISTNNPYFFFGGALMERYGIYELIKAFNELCNNYKDIDLYICGHHADNKKLQDIIDKNKDITARIENAYKALNIHYEFEPIRGGTDGAQLTFMGFPTPNIATGDYNCHGRFEYVDVNESETVIKILQEMVKI